MAILDPLWRFKLIPIGTPWNDLASLTCSRYSEHTVRIGSLISVGALGAVAAALIWAPGASGETLQEIREASRELRNAIRRLTRCLKRLGPSIELLAGNFVTSLQRGNEPRACKLLTTKERERLGGAGCAASLAVVSARVCADREPTLSSFELDLGFERGELNVRLLRPFEKVALRFTEEKGLWRINNVRDLLRQQAPAGAAVAQAPAPGRGR